MNRKQLALLVVLLVILGGAGILIQNSRNKNSDTAEAGVGQKLLGNNFPINDVTRLVIKGATNELNLVKKDDVWRVQERNDYPASFPQISDFLIKASELKVVQSEAIGASQLARMQLVPPPGQGTNSGVLLELKGKDDKTLRTVLVGKKHSRKAPGEDAGRVGDEGLADGRYVMLEGDKTHALLIGDALENIEPKPEAWLNKDFFKIEKPKSIAVTFPDAPTNSWKLTRETESGEWKLADAKKDEKLDSGKTGGVTSPFASPTFNDVLPPSAKPEEHGLGKPTVVSIETFDNFDYTINVGKKLDDNYPVKLTVTANLPKERTAAKDEKAEDKDKADKIWQAQQKLLQAKLKTEKAFEGWTFLVPSWNVDSILKERKDLMADKKDDKAAAPGTKKDDALPADLGIPGLDKNQ